MGANEAQAPTDNEERTMRRTRAASALTVPRTAVFVLAALALFSASAAVAGPEYPPVCPYLQNCP